MMNPIIALEPKTQRMLTGPSAPREDQMEEWLSKHPSFHLVMPREVSTSKFYGNKKPQPVPRAIKMSSANPGSKTTAFQLSGIKTSPTSGVSLSSPSPEKKLLSSPSSEYQILRNPSKYSPTAKSQPSSQPPPPPMPQKSIPITSSSSSSQSASSKKSSSLPSLSSSSSSGVERRKSTVQRGETSYAPPPTPPVDPKPIRENAKKGRKDALKTRMAKAESDEHKLSEDKLAELVHDVESELYRLYNRDVGPKYKNKYRSLVFNLKDEKNFGLFRKVVTRRIGPRALVAMTAEELASKELKEWRQAEQKGEIEKIRAHELDLAKQGNKFVIKTHKGDQIVDVDDNNQVEKKPEAEEVKLPEELPDPEKRKRESSKSKQDDHRRRDKESSRDRDRHRSSRDHRRSKERSSEERHRHRSKDGKDRDKERRSSGKDSEKKPSSSSSSSSSSRDKDRHRHHHHHHKSSSSQQHKSSSSREKESREEREERERKRRVEKEEAESKRRKEVAEREEEARKKALAEKADKVLFEFQACSRLMN